jgi:hypothetical protein
MNATAATLLKERLLHYLSQHPTAKDTVHGIATFWLGADPALVAAALGELVEDGTVEEVRAPGTVYYRRRRS